jgi:hypothetical protein
MPTAENLFTARKSLDEICTTPEKIISVYSLEKHVWRDSNAIEAQKKREPELQTIEEFQFDPVRPFLTDILRQMAAPYNKEKRENPVGQGYWIQAEFGSGKSHLLCSLAALALGDKKAWEMVEQKEKKTGRGKRESLYRFWEEGIEGKGGGGKKGIFVIVKTLVGFGGGTVGIAEQGKRLVDYVIDAAKDQLQAEVGKNLSLYPVELLADRFLKEDVDRYRNDLKKFLRDPKFWEPEEFEEVDKFIGDIQENKSPEYKRSRGNKLWRFYTEYLKVQPQIAMDSEDVLKHLVEVIMAEGYSGVLLVLDEVSLFMKDRDDDLRVDDERTLVVLSNRLAKIHNLPVWTVCAAQQAIESKMGVKNIIADDRLKLVKLLEEDKDYYSIVLARVRGIKDPTAISNYYAHYKKGFTWPTAIGETEFAHFFPFHKPALEVLRAVSYELTTTRSAIHFMHQTLKYQIKVKGNELVRLWELFDEAVRYEEDPSGVHAGITSIKTKREAEYRAYEACKRQIEAVTSGALKVYRDRAVKTIQTLFLFHVSRTRQQGLNPEEIANSVLIERQPDSTSDENIQHYESLAENLRKQVRQVAQSFDEGGKPLYRFEPVVAGIDAKAEFQKARDEAEANKALLQQAWSKLLTLGEWPVQTRQMRIDVSNGVRSIFRDLQAGSKKLTLPWKGREIDGQIYLNDLAKLAGDSLSIPAISTDETEEDFAVHISTKPVSEEALTKLLNRSKDPRVLYWCPDELTPEEQAKLLDFAAYVKLIESWQGKTSEDATTVINWVTQNLQTELASIAKIVDSTYGRGRIDALNNTQMKFIVAGELPTILSPLVEKVLSSLYESRELDLPASFVFRREEAVKVINGIVKTGDIPKNAKPNQNISAAQNFGFGLKIIKKSSERKLDTSDNPFVSDLWKFIDEKLADDQSTMGVVTLFKNFMGIGVPKNYGLSRRMIQIFLLCLVKEGKVRVGVHSKAAVAGNRIDYANIGDIDFSAKILDALTEVQKMAQPENWEVLRPYAEKLLDETLPGTNDDAVISQFRKKLQQLFASEKDESARSCKIARSLFDALGSDNPYAAELTQMAKLFEADVSSGDDIALLLFALEQAFGYQAYSTSNSAQQEIDDLGNRIRDYRNLLRFLRYENELRIAHEYVQHELPEAKELQLLQAQQKDLAEKLTDLRPFIDSEVRLKTELIGKIPADAQETGTLGALVRDFTTQYDAMFSNTTFVIDQSRGQVQALLTGTEFKAFQTLEGVSALQPGTSDALSADLNGIEQRMFDPGPVSKSSIDGELQSKPAHSSGLTFANAAEKVRAAEEGATQAATIYDEALNKKLSIFLSPSVRTRLEQGRSEAVIEKLLSCKTPDEVRKLLLPEAEQNPGIVQTINRYLKKISVLVVKMEDFHPTLDTVEKDQVDTVVAEFKKYLQDRLREAGESEDTLPVLRFE